MPHYHEPAPTVGGGRPAAEPAPTARTQSKQRPWQLRQDLNPDAPRAGTAQTLRHALTQDDPLSPKQSAPSRPRTNLAFGLPMAASWMTPGWFSEPDPNLAKDMPGVWSDMCKP